MSNAGRVKIDTRTGGVIFYKEDFLLAQLVTKDNECSITVYVRGGFRQVIEYDLSQVEDARRDFETLYNAIARTEPTPPPPMELK